MLRVRVVVHWFNGLILRLYRVLLGFDVYRLFWICYRVSQLFFFPGRFGVGLRASGGSQRVLVELVIGQGL